jgi:hypothetical protein
VGKRSCVNETAAVFQAHEGKAPRFFRRYSGLTATLNALPFTVRSCNVAALWRLAMSALLAAGSVIVAIAPIFADSPNGPGAKRL